MSGYVGVQPGVTAEQAIEALCAYDIGIWAEAKLGYVNAPHHWEWYDLISPVSPARRRMGIVAPREHAKALALDTPVLGPGGWTSIGDIVVGDTVIGGDGQPTTVTAVSPVFLGNDCYRVRLDDGQVFVADAGHRWIAYYAWRGTRTVTTLDLVAGLAHPDGQAHVIDCVAMDSPEVDLPLDPYALGCWLGDGTAARGEITSADPEIIDAIPFEPSYRYQHSKAVTVGFPGFGGVLRRLGVLRNKHVPERYLWAGTKQRLALLQGLLDTDGTCTRQGQVIFANTNERLTAAVTHLAWSLGYKPKRYRTRATLYGKDCGPVWGVAFYPADPVFRLEQKAANQRRLPEGRRSKATGRAVRDVEPVPSVPVRCITTGTGSYLIGNGVVTHNSEIFTVNHSVHAVIYQPGIWVYVFGATLEVCDKLRERINAVIEATAPNLIGDKRKHNTKESIFSNGSRISYASAGKTVRTAHPDIIIGDDVLDEEKCLTDHQRKKTHSWWFGTIGGMAHPGTTRVLPTGERRTFPPTLIVLVGTPFHQSDLLMSLRRNRQYLWRRYDAELPARMPYTDSLAVEATA